MIAEKIQLENDERILLQVRKHWFVLCMQVSSIVLLSLVPLFAYFVIGGVLGGRMAVLPTGLPIALYSGWLIIMWMFLFSIWTNYYLDMWIVTNKRLIAIDQMGFFRRSVASFRLERMQDIKVSVDGILATFLDYGSLEIQTAGEENNFKVHGIPSPADIKATILASNDTLISREKYPSTGEV